MSLFSETPAYQMIEHQMAGKSGSFTNRGREAFLDAVDELVNTAINMKIIDAGDDINLLAQASANAINERMRCLMATRPATKTQRQIRKGLTVEALDTLRSAVCQSRYTVSAFEYRYPTDVRAGRTVKNGHRHFHACSCDDAASYLPDFLNVDDLEVFTDNGWTSVLVVSSDLGGMKSANVHYLEGAK